MKQLVALTLLTLLQGSYQQGLSKLLVATGKKGSLRNVEVINLEDPTKTCNDLPDLPNGLKGPTGQLFNKTTPIVCGGIEVDSTKDYCECYSFVRGEKAGDGEWITYSSPKECGTYARSVVLTSGNLTEGDEERDDLWLLTGGLVGSSPIARTEAYDGIRWLPEAVRKLPFGVYLHCLVKVSNDVLWLIGGTTEKEHASALTYVYDNNDDSWTKGPPLNEGRSGHACGVLSKADETTGAVEKFIVVAGGSTGSDYAKQVELLKISDSGEIADAWTEGPALPKNVLFGAMVHHKDSIFLVGGGGDSIKNATLEQVTFDGNSIFQLSSPTGEWVEFPQKLKIERSQIATFLVPDDFVQCE